MVERDRGLEILKGRVGMNDKDCASEQEWHRKTAIGLFNAVWGLLDRKDRTPADDDLMVHSAHASRYHWGEVGTPVEFERGEWQISRVYSVLERPEPALHHAVRCLEICRENGITDFDIAFAYEAMARAYAVAGDAESCGEYTELGRQAGQQIDDEENRSYFLAELDAVTGILRDR
jgi:hypothetical protein